MMPWTKAVYLAMNWGSLFLAFACLAAAPAVLLRAKFPRPSPRLGTAALMAVPVIAGLLKLAMYHTFQLTSDSACVLHAAWNAAHGYGLVSSIEPPSHLAAHFSLFSVMISPILLIWNSSASLALLQGAALGSSVPAVYLLARRAGGSREAAGLAALLAFAHPAFQGLLGTTIEDSVFAAPLFLWAAYFWSSGRRAWAVLLAGLFLITKEEAPLVLAGVALALAWRRPRHWSWAALLAGSVACWWFEMRVIRLYRGSVPCWGAGPWGLFAALGGDRIADHLLHRPWDFPLALVLPLGKIGSVLELLLYAGFFPLRAGAVLLALAVPWLPHQLADYQTNYHRLLSYYPGFVLGPLLLAMVLGLCRSFEKVAGRLRPSLVAYVLVVAGLGLFKSAGYYRSNLLPSAWSASVPRIAAMIPADAKVWCDGYLLAHLGLRRHVKWLPTIAYDCYFETEPFVPDYIVLSTYWTALAEPRAVEKIFGYIRDGSYEEALRDGDLVVFKRK